MKTRPYTMGARAEATEATADRILEAALQLFTENSFEDVSLDDVADAAEVTTRTVIRRFESKEQLFVKAIDRAVDVMMAQRAEAPVGDIEGAVKNVIDHYEEWGDNRLRMLAQEERIPVVRDNARGGRQYHREWVARVFSPLLKGLSGAARERRLATLILATDVFTWKLLRRDHGFSRAQTERTIIELIYALKGETA
jgi:AcrR family transcriptional regulator